MTLPIALICPNAGCGKESISRSVCSHCGQPMFREKEASIPEIAKEIQAAVSQSSDDLSNYAVDIKPSPDVENEIVASLPSGNGSYTKRDMLFAALVPVASGAAFIAALGGIVGGLKDFKELIEDKDINEIQMDEAKKLDAIMAGKMILTDDQGSTSYRIILRCINCAKYGSPLQKGDSEKLKEILYRQSGDPLLIISGICSKIAMNTGNIELSETISNNSISTYFQNRNKHSRLSPASITLIGQTLPLENSKMVFSDLYNSNASLRCLKLLRAIKTIEDRYENYVTAADVTRKKFDSKHISEAEMDLLRKCQIYKIMAECRRGQELGIDCSNYLEEILIERAKFNPRESLLSIAPLVTSLIDSNNIDIAIHLADIARRSFSRDNTFGMADIASNLLDERSLDYSIYLMMELQLYKTLRRLDKKPTQENISTYRGELVKNGYSNMKINAFVAGVSRLIGNPKDRGVTLSARIIDAVFQKRKTHRAYFTENEENEFLSPNNRI